MSKAEPRRRGEALEPEHGTDALFDAPVVLLKVIDTHQGPVGQHRPMLSSEVAPGEAGAGYPGNPLGEKGTLGSRALKELPSYLRTPP